MIPRFNLRLPIPVAAAIVAAAYLIRSVFIRGGDFSLDVADAVLVGLLAVALVAIALIRGRQETKTKGHAAQSER